LGVHYCPGYVDKNNTWKTGFYCSPQTKKIYCCGTPQQKYCCSVKDFGTSQHR
ncbi:membrane protein FAM159A-like protein, partial [Leptotrombidium deliense]